MGEENVAAKSTFLATKTLWIEVSAIVVSVFVMGCLCFHFKRNISKCCKFWPKQKGELGAGETWVKKFHLQELQKAANKVRPRMSQVWQELETALQTRVQKLPCEEPCSQNSREIDDVGLQRYHEDMDNNSISFHSPSLRRFVYSTSIDAAAINLRGIGSETESANKSNIKNLN